jgi:hypothetical protein
MAFSLSPSVDVREFDLTLTIPNLPSSKTGMVVRADYGYGLQIRPVTNETDLVNESGAPTAYNYQDWFQVWNFLQYASSGYMARAIDATAENAGVEITASGGIIAEEKLSQGEMYNPDKAELTLEGLSPEGFQFYNRFVTSDQKFGVAVCMQAAYWNQPFCSENIDRITAAAFDGTAQFGDSTGTIVYDGNNIAVGDVFTAEMDATTTTTFTVLFDDGTSVGVTPKLLLGDGTSPYVGAIEGATAIKSARNSIFSSDLVNSDNTLPNFSSFFEYEPNWSAGEFGLIVFQKDNNDQYDVFEDEIYILSKKESGRSADTGGNIFVDQYLFNSSNAIYGTYNATAAPTINSALSRFTEITGTITTDENTKPMWLYPAKKDYDTDTSAFISWIHDPAGYTQADVINAFNLFSDPESFDINILVAHQLDMNYASTIAETRKDCVAIVAPYAYTSIVGKTPTEATAYMVANFGSTVTSPATFNTFGTYSAVYSNMKYQYDKFNDVNRWIGIGGDIAGLAAQTDANRDPWWAIAGLERGKIKNAIKPAYNPSKANRDELYVNALNPVISVPGEGIMITWGQKTATARPSAFDRLNVRRLLITLEKAIASAARYSLFEFNDEFTRSRLRQLIEPFLRDVKGRRGITDFQVVVDESNNTAEVIDKNALVIDVYIKPTRVAEFIQINMKVTRTDANFDELIGRG